jgi:nicotinate-nucleotide adenylyltransferase
MAAIGILGGTFDPVHNGHVCFAEDARDGLGLGEVRLIPVGDPPHREPPYAPAADRLAMVRLAIADRPGLRADDVEVCRAGPSYTVLTLETLRAELGAIPLCLLLGADALAGLGGWHRWHELFALAHLVVAARPGSIAPDELPAAVRDEWVPRLAHDVQDLHTRSAGRTFHLRIRPHLISASDLRQRLADGERPGDLLPPPVLAYIDSHHLYRNRAHLADAS